MVGDFEASVAEECGGGDDFGDAVVAFADFVNVVVYALNADFDAGASEFAHEDEFFFCDVVWACFECESDATVFCGFVFGLFCFEGLGFFGVVEGGEAGSDI